ncbi:MAG: hypothetical protein JWM17_1835 [Actinobacteria bacterium]|jgi:hypothetical protein|nr:hypothetical protein [Actinomycetota bacterium]
MSRLHRGGARTNRGSPMASEKGERNKSQGHGKRDNDDAAAGHGA